MKNSMHTIITSLMVIPALVFLAGTISMYVLAWVRAGILNPVIFSYNKINTSWSKLFKIK